MITIPSYTVWSGATITVINPNTDNSNNVHKNISRCGGMGVISLRAFLFVLLVLQKLVELGFYAVNSNIKCESQNNDRKRYC